MLLFYKPPSLAHFQTSHQQQNEWYPQRRLLAHFEATLDLSRSEFTWP